MPGVRLASKSVCHWTSHSTGHHIAKTREHEEFPPAIICHASIVVGLEGVGLVLPHDMSVIGFQRRTLASTTSPARGARGGVHCGT